MKTPYRSVFLLHDQSRELSIPFWLGYVGDVLSWGLSLCFGFIICLLYVYDVMEQYGWLNPIPGDYMKDESLTLWQMNDFHLGEINNYCSLPMHCKVLE